MAETLTEYLKQNPPSGFTSSAEYFEIGDFVTYFVAPDMHYGRRVDGLLTVYYSESTDQVIGFKIKSVKAILKNMGRYGIDAMNVEYDGAGIRLSLLFLSAAEMSDSGLREKYQEMARLAKAATISREKLPADLAA